MADLGDGETVEMKGSGARPYVLKNVGGVYSCTCPAWRNQSTAIERRTCKHLRKLRGEDAECERLGGELPARAVRAKREADGPPLLLAQTWDSATDLSGWWMSEKLDGVRAYWDGEAFHSRQGNPYHAPDWFTAGLPATPLDGELWIDRKSFQRTVSIVRRQDRSEHWREVRYRVFDAPAHGGAFEERLAAITELLVPGASEHAAVHPHERCESLTHLREELARLEALGAEGLMLRQPGSGYEVGRSFTLLKVKSFFDAEAVVVDHQPGKGKFKGMLGALVVELADGTRFSVGTGFSDAERTAPPGVGSTITFRYQELSDGGVPRFPSFLRTRDTSVDSGVVPRAAPGVPAPPAPAAALPPAAPGEGGGGDARRFELVEGKSSKFWEVVVDGADVTVRYGRIGSKGQSRTKSFSGEQAAAAHAEKLIGEKKGKGYVES